MDTETRTDKQTNGKKKLAQYKWIWFIELFRGFSVAFSMASMASRFVFHLAVCRSRMGIVNWITLFICIKYYRKCSFFFFWFFSECAPFAVPYYSLLRFCRQLFWCNQLNCLLFGSQLIQWERKSCVIDMAVALGASSE